MNSNHHIDPDQALTEDAGCLAIYRRERYIHSMITRTLVIVVMLFYVIIPTRLFAQLDSTNLDLGYTSVKKEFVQHVTVKGEDLQKLPFSTIEEAINVYFGGAFTTRRETTYVIDGNISTSIDALSVYDIESITLVQNAQVLLNGANGPAQLVLVKTKSGSAGKTGIIAAASAYLVKRKNGETGKYEHQRSPTFFQQYSLAGNYVQNRSELGLSISFLREAFPVQTNENTIQTKPHRLNRFRGNAWFVKRMGKHSSLTLRLNASPQDSGNAHHFHALPFGEQRNEVKGTAFTLYPSARLFTRISKAWTNDFHLSYAYSEGTNRDLGININDYYNGLEHITKERYLHHNKSFKQNQLLIRDRIAFEKKLDKWTINPAVNLVFAHWHSNMTSVRELVVDTGRQEYSGMKNEMKRGDWAVTPSIGFSFNDLFCFSGGVQFNSGIVPFSGPDKTKLLPFVSATLDVAEMIRPRSIVSASLYASYAKGKGEMGKIFFPDDHFGSSVPGNNYTIILSDPILFNKDADLLILGTTLAIPDKGFQFTYAFERNTYFQAGRFEIPFNGSYFLWTTPVKTDLSGHRFTINFRTKETGRFKYNSGLNLYKLGSSLRLTEPRFHDDPDQDKSLYAKNGYTGGWINSFSFKGFTTGVNVMYYFKKDVNAVLLQHLYFGYTATIGGHRTEIYASLRNAAQSKNSKIETGYKSYYGLGFNIQL